jgi:DNA-directed RNA polymerase specialized sigma24 family protein
VSIIFARSREVPESALLTTEGDTPSSLQQAFSTENESPFAEFKPKLKQTGVFIDRFFHGLTYKDLATKYDMSASNARKTYHNALKRLQQVLEAMDNPKGIRNLEHWKKQVEKRYGSLPKGRRFFLLNKLFGMRPSEIAELEGVKHPSMVRGMIIRVSDQLRAGEIRLWEAEPEEAEAAKSRLHTTRNKLRRQVGGKD